MKRQLRDYQQEGYDAVFHNLQKGVKRQLMVYATGLGKTFTASQIMDRFQRTLWITHVEELINQSAISILRDRGFDLTRHRNILEFLDDAATWGMFASDEDKAIRNEIGVIKQHRMDTDCKVAVASIQTLHRRLDKIDPAHYDLVIIDEAHLSGSTTFSKVIEHFKPTLLLGLTATPKRADGISLANHFDEIVIEKDIKFGIDNGYLVELDAIRIKTTINLDTVKTTGGDLNQGQLEKLLDTPQRNAYIADSFLKYTPHARALGFCIDVDHAIHMTKAFRDKGISADFVVADKERCPDRGDRLRKFRTGETQVLFNVMILTVGFDAPFVDCIIMCRPTKSLTLYLQAIGRGTRPFVDSSLPFTSAERIAEIRASNKPKCTILDIVDVTNRHSLINSFTLDKGKSIADQVFITRAKKDEMLFKLRQNRKLDFDRDSDEKVSLLALPKYSVTKSLKMLEPATEKQIEWLKREGVWQEGVEYTKRDCSELIMGFKAQGWQLSKLASWGYDVRDGATVGEFQFAQAEQEKRELTKSRSALIKTAEERMNQSMIRLPFSDIE